MIRITVVCISVTSNLVLVYFKASVQSIQPDFCPITSREYLRYRAKVSLPKSAIVEHDNKVLTSVAAMPYHNHTVIFIGTAQGRLLKVCRVDGFLVNLAKTFQE